MLTYEKIEEEAMKKYSDSMWERISFIEGAVFALKQVGLESMVSESIIGSQYD